MFTGQRRLRSPLPLPITGDRMLVFFPQFPVPAVISAGFPVSGYGDIRYSEHRDFASKQFLPSQLLRIGGVHLPQFLLQLWLPLMSRLRLLVLPGLILTDFPVFRTLLWLWSFSSWSRIFAVWLSTS